MYLISKLIPGLITACLFSAGIARAQDIKKLRPAFRGNIAAGFAAGESPIGLSTQLSGAWKRNRVEIGAGFGYDTYFFKSYPLFAELRYTFDRRQVFFAYGQAGYNFIGKKSEGDQFSRKEFNGGFYSDAGLGFYIPLRGVHRLSLTTGISMKYQRHDIIYTSFWCPTCEPTISRSYYKLGRIATRLSWQIGR